MNYNQIEYFKERAAKKEELFGEKVYIIKYDAFDYEENIYFEGLFSNREDREILSEARNIMFELLMSLRHDAEASKIFSRIINSADVKIKYVYHDFFLVFNEDNRFIYANSNKLGRVEKGRLLVVNPGHYFMKDSKLNIPFPEFKEVNSFKDYNLLEDFVTHGLRRNKIMLNDEEFYLFNDAGNNVNNYEEFESVFGETLNATIRKTSHIHYNFVVNPADLQISIVFDDRFADCDKNIKPRSKEEIIRRLSAGFRLFNPIMPLGFF